VSKNVYLPSHQETTRTGIPEFELRTQGTMSQEAHKLVGLIQLGC
jgi:hypothetical protein